MDNQDKIFDKYKEAAHNAESKDFPGMEKVWSRVEDKLDKKEDKKAISLWKKIAIAASLLLLISLGSQFLKSDKTTTIQTPKVVVNETEKETVKNVDSEKNNAVVSSDSPLIPKEEAISILKAKAEGKGAVAIQEASATTVDTQLFVAPVMAMEEVAASAPAKSEYQENEVDNMLSKKEAASEMAYSKEKERQSAKVAFSAEQRAQKNSPLVILNGRALSHSDDAKRDKMMQAELPNVKPENVESLVILDEPLYIIDGIYYSENDLFGDNPTSPYAPLNSQEIKTITILQDLEATAKYGEKGKKGVVIITTKTGKPALKK
jgi:hypothetical protein